MAKKPKPRRARGSGYVTYNKKRGTYKAVYAGKSKSFSTASDAESWRAEQHRIASAPPPRFADQTLSIALAELLEAKAYTRDGTQEQYEHRAKVALRTIGNIPITSITSATIAAMDQTNRKTLAAETCEHVLTLLYTMFDRLIALDVLTKNPVAVYRKLIPSRARGGRAAREPVVLTPAQVRTLLRAIDGEYLAPFLTWLCVLPLRVSELRGLTRDNVHVTKRMITISEQRTHRDPHQPAPPKSKESMRDLPITHDLIRCMPNQRSHLNLVFPNTVGNPVYDESLRDCLRRAHLVADLPVFRIHDLRHTAASNIVNLGCPKEYIRALLGHAPRDVTDRYVTVDMEVLRPYVEAWSAVVFGSGANVIKMQA